MRKILLFIFVSLVISIVIFTSCTSPSSGPPPPTGESSVYGMIVDQNGDGVRGINVIMGSYNVTTSIDGEFAFIDISPGEYIITGKGGDNEHCIAVPTNVSVIEGQENNVGNIVAYNVIGCGVVIQSPANISSLSLFSNNSYSNISAPSKQIDILSVNKYSEEFLMLKEVFVQQSMSSDILRNNISLVYIKWEELVEDWITWYRIYYLGPDKNENQLVWDSEDEHLEDPEYDPDFPDAYLDLGSELAGFIDNVGTYYFKVVGTDSSGYLSKELPEVRVSIGMSLEDYPRDLVYTVYLLIWGAVDGTDGYRVQIYDELDERVYDSGLSLLNDTYLSVPGGLEAGSYYTWRVDAHAFDETGWTAEITRGISGFVP